jgi:hypothetical protein
METTSHFGGEFMVFHASKELRRQVNIALKWPDPRGLDGRLSEGRKSSIFLKSSPFNTNDMLYENTRLGKQTVISGNREISQKWLEMTWDNRLPRLCLILIHTAMVIIGSSVDLLRRPLIR